MLDVGASTGGFTEVCLASGAAQVFAVDVGRDQLHRALRTDARVVSLEGADARKLTTDQIDEPPQLIVCDASFIGLAKVLPAALRSQAQAATCSAWSSRSLRSVPSMSARAGSCVMKPPGATP